MRKPRQVPIIAKAQAKYAGRTFTFDGTIADLVTKAREHGAKDGSIVQASFGFNFTKMKIVSATCGGFWAHRA